MTVFFYIKFLLKGGYINSFKKFQKAKSAWMGRNVSIFFDQPGGNQLISLGENVRIGHFSDLSVGTNNSILIKDNTTLNTHCKIIGDVTIERYCLLSANILISSGSHYATRFPHLLIRLQDRRVLASEEGMKEHSQPVHIEEDVWIGFGVYIKQGITIGRGAVVGANSVVLHDVKPYEIVAGSPARKIKSRLEFNPPTEIEASNEEHLPYFYRGFDHYKDTAPNLEGIFAEKVMWAYEESTIAIPVVLTCKISIKGFIAMPSSFSVKVSVDGSEVGNFQVSESLFQFNIIYESPLKNKPHDHSFINFVIPFDKRLQFGINRINIEQL